MLAAFQKVAEEEEHCNEYPIAPCYSSYGWHLVESDSLVCAFDDAFGEVGSLLLEH